MRWTRDLKDAAANITVLNRLLDIMPGLQRAGSLELRIASLIAFAYPSREVEYRDAECLRCHFAWREPRRFCAVTTALSGEPYLQCPRCDGRNCMAGPAKPYRRSTVDQS